MPQVSPSKYLTTISWDDVPHLSEQTKRELLDSTPTYLRAARSRGEPVLGSGRIFPIDDERIMCDAFPIPDYWPRIRALDIGWDHPTALVDLAFDPDSTDEFGTEAVYVTKAYRESEKTVEQHAAAIKLMGDDWVPIAWPHDALQHDKAAGEQIAEQYRQQGLPMLHEMATWPEGHSIRGNAIASRTSVEAGLFDMLTRMEQGRFKVFRHLDKWFQEFRLYHREDGKVVKLIDDLLSATRYGIMMRRFATAKPAESNWRKHRDGGFRERRARR